MSDSFVANNNPNNGNHLSPLDGSEPEASIGTAQGAVEVLLALPSATMAPPVQTINEIGREVDPSPLTLPSSTVQSRTDQRGASARRVQYDATDTAVMLSVPVTSEMSYSNKDNNSGTYQDGYVSDGEVGPFFDAVATQKDDDDDEFDEVEHVSVSDSEESEQPETEVEPSAILPNFQITSA